MRNQKNGAVASADVLIVVRFNLFKSVKKLFFKFWGFLFLNFIIFCSGTKAEDYIGYVFSNTGQLQRSSKNEANQFSNIAANDFLLPGDRVKTAQGAQSYIFFRDGSVLKMFGSSVVELRDLVEFRTRRFQLSFNLEEGTISALISQNVRELSAQVNTYLISGMFGGCFSARNEPSLGLTRIKAADLELQISEGLIRDVVKPRQVFFRFEQAFAFTSKSLTYLPRRVLVAVDRYIDPLFSVTVELIDIEAAINIKQNLPLQILGAPRDLFAEHQTKLDADGYILLQAKIPPIENFLEDNITCIDVDDSDAIFSYATGVIRGAKASEY